jgi:uncharacterized delta-60 repeat protein
MAARAVQAAPAALKNSLRALSSAHGAEVTESVNQLTKGIMRALLLEKVKPAAGLVLGVALLATVSRALSQQPGSLDLNFKFGLNGGSVAAVQSSLAIQPDGRILLAGGFANGVATNGNQVSYYSGFARLNYDGSVDTSFATTATNFNFKPINEADGYAIAVQKSGKIVIGGYWLQTNALKHANIARLNPDGTLDPTFNPGAGTDWQPTPPTTLVSYVFTQEDDKILVGGRFSQIAGTSRNGLARLNPDGSIDESFQPPPAAQLVNLQNPILKDGRIVVMNTFSNGISRLKPDGTLDPTFMPISLSQEPFFNPPYALQSEGGIIGTIGVSYGSTSATLGRFNSTGTRDSSFAAVFTRTDTKTSPYVLTDIAVDESGKVLVVGRFDKVNGSQRFDVARLNSDGTLDQAFDAGPRLANQVTAQRVFIQPDGRILVSGYTKTNGINTPYLLRLLGNSSLRFSSLNQASGASMRVTLESQGATSVLIEISTNFKDWAPLTMLTNSAGASTLDFEIQRPVSTSSAFYRAALGNH